MKVSIIIPVYNVEDYIKECLDSVFSQTYENIEVIIVDDCGNDNSMKIIYQYIESLPQSKQPTIIHHDKNKGISAARNSGIRKATGEYLYFIDSDDYISKRCIESFIQLAEQYQYPNIIFGTAIEVPHLWKKIIISVNSPQIPTYVNNTQWIRRNYFKFKDELLPIPAWNKLTKKDYIIKNNLFFEEGFIYEDRIWYWYIGNTTNHIVFNKECTYYYRYVPNSIINKKYSYINLYSEMRIIKILSKNIKFRYLISQIKYILHNSHSLYCSMQKREKLQPRFIRYPKVFFFFIKCLFIRPKTLY